MGTGRRALRRGPRSPRIFAVPEFFWRSEYAYRDNIDRRRRRLSEPYTSRSTAPLYPPVIDAFAIINRDFRRMGEISNRRRHWARRALGLSAFSPTRTPGTTPASPGNFRLPKRA